MQLTQKQKRLLRWVGLPLLALIVFVFTVHLTFPYERVKDRAVAALADRYEVKVAAVKRTFLPGGLIFEGVSLTPRQPAAAAPKADDDNDQQDTVPLYIDSLRIDLGLLAAIRGRADVDILAELGGGAIEGNVQLSKLAVSADFSTEALPLETLPGVGSAVGGLPMTGGLDLDLAVDLPEGRWDKANGEITLRCPGCTVGDGKTKIKPKTRPGARARRSMLFAKEGLTVPKLDLGEMSGKIVITDGRG
ncbi:MAG: type II secretion system protein GspN, partial [Myxococcota bacterium]